MTAAEPQALSERVEGALAAMEVLWETVRDDIPESFWKVAVWVPGGSYVTGSLDVADRRRIGIALLTAAAPDPALTGGADGGEGA